MFDLDRLAMNDADVASLTRRDREQRVRALTVEAEAIVQHAIHVLGDGKTIVGIVGLFSGGNDSTTLCHLMLPRITHLAHANTTIGIEQTRQYVRDTAATWAKPLLEFTPPRTDDHYASLVRAHGFPGPAHHYKMFQRLKERGMRQVRRALVTNSRSERVVFLAGRRRTESDRRALVPEMQREGAVIWASPLVNWTKLDLNTYRLMAGDVPVNEVSDLIHMSGECLCGAFAHAGELEEIGEWFPEVVSQIRALEAEIADRADIPEERKTWGWGAYRERPTRKPKSGAMCSSCDARWQQGELLQEVAV